jgi:hypothetical protein
MNTGVVDCDEGLYRLFGVDPAEASGSFDLYHTGEVASPDRCR